MSLTVEQVFKAAQARAMMVTPEIPMTEAVGYRRIGVRQAQLLVMGGKTNPEFYGEAATADLSGGAVDFGDVADPTPIPALIDQIVIANPGTSAWPQGQEVFVVPANDVGSAIPPRATLRDRVLRQVGADLAGVTSVTMYYTRSAPVYDFNSGTSVVELASPHDELLVLDLAARMLLQSPSASSAAAVALLADIATETSQAMTEFLAFVRDYAPMGARFGTGI